jgi:hypothetical protein
MRVAAPAGPGITAPYLSSTHCDLSAICRQALHGDRQVCLQQPLEHRTGYGASRSLGRPAAAVIALVWHIISTGLAPDQQYNVPHEGECDEVNL